MISFPRKGSALLITIFILMAILVASLTGLQAYSKHFGREVARQELGYAQGYYRALSGLRYAAILIQNSTITFTGNVYNVTGQERGGDLFNALGTTNANLRITITDLRNGQYQIDAVANY